LQTVYLEFRLACITISHTTVRKHTNWWMYYSCVALWFITVPTSTPTTPPIHVTATVEYTPFCYILAVNCPRNEMKKQTWNTNCSVSV